MLTSNSMRWLVVAVSAAMLLAVVAACSSETIEVPGETVVVKEVVTETVEVPGETVVVEKEVIRTVEVPGETVTKEVVKEVMVPGETVVVKEEVIKTVEIPGQTVVKEVVKTVEVPGETVVVEKEVVKTVEVPGETVVVTKEVAVPVEVVREVPSGKNYVTDPTTGKAVSAPQYGGTLTIPSGAEHEIADAWFVSGNAGWFISGVLEKLVIGDWAVDRDEFGWTGKNIPPEYLIGQLAESWDISPDGLTYTFHIRQGVHWHNKPPTNGRELTAQDIEYNYHRLLGMGSGFTEPSPVLHAMTALQFESITATDKYTVVFKLKRPHINAFALITDWWTNFIYSPEVIEKYGDAKDWRNVVGTGPWMLTDWVEGSSYTFIKNPDYWGYDEKYPENRLPYIDQLRVLVMLEDATRLAAMRSGKVDWGGGGIGTNFIASIDQAESLQRSNPEIELHKYWTRSNWAFSMNLNNPLFSDIRVRIAMQKALALETIANTFFKGYANWEPRGRVGDSLKGYYVPYEEWPEEIKERYTYDPAAAEALLDEVGFPRGADGIRFKTNVIAITTQDTGYVELATAYWREIGIAVEIEVLDIAQYVKIASSSNHEAIRINEMSMHYLAEHLVGRFYGKQPAWKSAGREFTDPDFDAKFEAMRATTDLEEYKRLFRELDMYATEKHWMIWGPESPQFTWNQPWVIGYNGEANLGEAQDYAILARLWIDSELKEAMGH